ncbi:hypothetical protein FQR65_LT17583 [Abscondita terminalis]|nr:hypothetical protein FQR65_LT17583 [Abscondita terminalis]
MRLDMSTESLNIPRSESVTDLNSEPLGGLPLRSRSSFSKDPDAVPSKPFGLVGMISPGNPKLGLRMTTLHEEQSPLPRKHSLELINDESNEEKYEYEDAKSKYTNSNRTMWNGRKTLPTSRTLDSLVELAPKTSTPSASSSGYGSQAVSSTNLSSEDSMSLRSISVDETPDFESRPPLTIDLKPVTEVADVNIDGEHSEDENKADESCRSDDVLSNEDTYDNDSNSNGKMVLLEPIFLPGKVVRRVKSSKNNHHSQQQRASFPQARPQLSESKAAQNLEDNTNIDLQHADESVNNYNDRLDDDRDNNFGSRPDLNKLADVPVPDWVVIGESVLIRPYNSSGVVAYIGPTEFASGTWVGVDLDAPKGKNDGSVQGICYFTSRPKHGMFVRADKLILDRRGRAMRVYKSEANTTSSRGKDTHCHVLDQEAIVLTPWVQDRTQRPISSTSILDPSKIPPINFF